MISLRIDGNRYEAEVGSDVPLLWVIREYPRLTGTSSRPSCGERCVCSRRDTGAAPSHETRGGDGTEEN